jgi:hypothetical protein
MVLVFMTSCIPLLVSLAINSRPPAQPPQLSAPATRQRVLSACSAVTKSDVELALGRSVSGGKEEFYAGESTCDYAGGNGQVTITLQRISGDLDIPAELESLKAMVPEANVREVSGIGSRAYLLDIGKAGAQLHVLHGSREYLLVSVLGFGEAQKVTSAAESLARTALARL